MGSPFGIGIDDFFNYTPFYYQGTNISVSTSTPIEVLDYTGSGYLSTAFVESTGSDITLIIYTDGNSVTGKNYVFDSFSASSNTAGIITPWTTGVFMDSTNEVNIMVHSTNILIDLPTNVGLATFPEDTDKNKFLLVPQPIFFKKNIRIEIVSTGATDDVECYRFDGAVRG